MRTLADLDEIEFLRQTNKIRKEITEPLKELNIVGVLRTPTIFTKDMTTDEKEAAAKEQAKKNIDKLLDILLEEKPEQTAKLIRLLVILDENEELNGAKIIRAAYQLFNSKDVIDFLSLLTR